MAENKDGGTAFRYPWLVRVGILGVCVVFAIIGILVVRNLASRPTTSAEALPAFALTVIALVLILCVAAWLDLEVRRDERAAGARVLEPPLFRLVAVVGLLAGLGAELWMIWDFLFGQGAGAMLWSKGTRDWPDATSTMALGFVLALVVAATAAALVQVAKDD